MHSSKEKCILSLLTTAFMLQGGCTALAILEPTQTSDVTNKIPFWGDFVVGEQYLLKRNAYLYKSSIVDVFARAPHGFNLEALEAAQDRYGDARADPTTAPNPEAERPHPLQWASEEHLSHETPMAKESPFVGILEAGTLIRLDKVRSRRKGEQFSLKYIGTALNGAWKGRHIDITGLSNYQFYGYWAQKRGYGPNPFMIEQVLRDRGPDGIVTE